MVEKLDDRGKGCPECGCINLIVDGDKGEFVCGNCGFVVNEDGLDRRPEWRAFTLEERRILPRTGAPINLMIHDKGLSSWISNDNKDYYGNSIRSRKKYKFNRLRKWDNRTKRSESKQRNLTLALNYMNRIGEEIHLPKNVLETASSVYRKALQGDMIRGNSIEGVSLASIYIACRQCKIVRSFETITEKTDYNVKQIARIYRSLFWELDAKIPRTESIGYVSKFVYRFDLPGEIEKIALQVLERAEERMLTSGKSPAGMAAASTYIACQIMKKHITQSELAQLANVTEVTIRNRYKELMEKLNLTIRL